MKDRWGLSVLGSAVLQRPDRPQETLERKAAALLAYVAVAGATPRATVAGLLWPNVVDARARNNLRQLLHRLRTFEDLLETDGEIRLGAVDADVVELQTLHDAGRATDIAARWGMQAPVLLEGHSYDDCPDLGEWVIAERERLLEIVRRALETEADRLEAAGDVRPALRLAQQLSTLDPLSEADYRRVMRLHYLSGDRGQAMATFRRCREVLHETFGLEPLPDTVELARAIDRGSFAGPRARPRATAALPITLLRPPQLVGRAKAWQALEDAWQRVHTIIIVGEAGIGKSHLMHDFAATRGEMLVTRGMPGDRNVAYASKARSLAAILREHPDYADEPWVRDELARILPEMFPRPAGQTPIADESQKLRLFEAAARVLGHALEGKAVLVNEDAHLWDDASFEMGAYFVSRFDGGPVRALVSYRIDELDAARRRTLHATAESGLSEIVMLEPLDHDAVADLIAGAGLDDGAPSAEEILRVSGGNPFYALEYLRSAWQEANGDVGGGPRPRNASAVLARRIERVTPTAADVLRVKAMAGTAYTPELAAAVLELPAATVRAAVDELERHRLLHEGDLAHELVADAIEDKTPPEASRLWHRRLAVQLDVFGAAAVAIARHYLAAWEPGPALAHLLQAGDDARAVFALEEAEHWYLRALWAAQDDRGRSEALVRLDDVAAQRGRSEAAAAILDELERIASVLQDPVLLVESALHRARWGTVRGEHALAGRAARRALDDALRLGDDERTDRARLALGDIAYFSGAYAEAHDHFLEVTRTGHEARRLRAFQRLGALEAMRGDVDAAFEHHLEALTLARRLHDVPLIATLLNSLGADRERRGAYEEAIGHFDEAAEVALRAADRRTGGIALSNASLTEVSRGELAAALAHAERALEITTPLGRDRSAAMAQFAHGYVLRRLGRFTAARHALQDAARLREAAADVRGALVARFNLAAIDLETAHGSDRADATARIEAVLTDLADLDIPQFYAWCLLELAFLTSDPDRVATRVDEAAALDDGPHLQLAAAAAGLRGTVLAGANGATTALRRTLLERLEVGPVLETSLAYLLLAHTAPSAEERGDLLARADARLRDEVGSLGARAVRSRRAYLARRMPDTV